MESQERTIGHLHLENGLSVYFIAQSSTPIAGRCQVRLLIRVPVQPIKDHFRNSHNPSQALFEFISLAGPGPVEFQTLKIRNFIDMNDVEKKLNEMKDDFIGLGLEYLKKPDFAAKFITKKYDEFCAKEALRRAQEKYWEEREGN